MMNINLNLLPPVKKSRLEYVLNFLLTKDILEIIIIVCASLGITLIWSWMILQDQFSDLVSSAVLVNRDSYGYNQDIKEINKIAENLIRIGKEYSSMSPKLIELIGTIPDDIRLDSIQMDRVGQKIILSGTAKTRNGLLNFQNKLQTVSWVGPVETPASQLFQKENVSFQFTANLVGLPVIETGQVVPKSRINSDDL